MQTQSNIPYALVIGRRHGEKFLRVITHQGFITIKTTCKYLLDGNPISIVTPESRCLQNAWAQARSSVRQPYHYKVGNLYVDTAVVNGKWESMVVCGGLHDTFVHHDEMEAQIFYLTVINAIEQGLAPQRIAEFAPVLVDAFADMHDKVSALALRNSVVSRLPKLPVKVGYRLLMSNTFQAGLNALDPDCPLFVESEAIREVVQRGLFAIIDQHQAEDALEEMEDEEIFDEDLCKDIDLEDDLEEKPSVLRVHVRRPVIK